MNEATQYRAGFVGRGQVIHITDHYITVCFDSMRGKSRRVEFAAGIASTPAEAIAKAVSATGAKVCQVCANHFAGVTA